jgi:hypothetical protein
MALGSTQPLTKMSTRKRPARRADNLAAICEPQHLASVACIGITLPYPYSRRMKRVLFIYVLSNRRLGLHACFSNSVCCFDGVDDNMRSIR